MPPADSRCVHGIGTICFVHKRSLHHWFSDRNTCLKQNSSLKPNGSATFSIAKQKVPCMTVFAVVNMFANEFLLNNEGSNAVFCSKPNGACKTKIISKQTKQSNIWYVAHVMCIQNVYPRSSFFLTISTWRSICHECKTCTPKVMDEQILS